MLGNLIEFLITQPKKSEGLRKADGLRNMQDFLKIVFCSSNKNRTNIRDRINRSYKVYAQKIELPRKRGSNKYQTILKFMCLSPAIG